MADINTKVASLLSIWKDDHVLAIESLFGIALDDQQKALVRAGENEVSRVAVKSCQGAGKTATLTWLSMLYLLILEDCRVLVTAPSAQQLNRVFHSEFLKWHAKMNPVFQPFFDIKKESVHIVGKPYQMISLVTGNPSNIEGLQGGHSKNYIVMCDEASGLEEVVFDTLQGTLGAGKSKMILTSNPVRNSGRFYEVFSKDLEKWVKLTFTAFGSSQIEEHWIEEMKEMHGEDSDNYQIRVLGNFGRFGEQQFIPSNIIEDANRNFIEFRQYANYPKVVGVDVARFGDDSTVLVLRQGPKILDITKYRGLDTMEVSARVVDYYHRHSPSLIYFDAIGIGAGVFDRCKELGLPCKEVVVSQKSTKPNVYGNLRAQLWGELKDWIGNGADIPNDDDLIKQLNSMQYTYNGKMQILLMSKKDIKRMGLDSPDIPDAISLTFADTAYESKVTSLTKRNVRKSNYCWV
jgi:phage terminase large subunit